MENFIFCAMKGIQRPSITKKYVIELSSSFIGKQSQETVYNSTSFLKKSCKEILII